jgi:hypothetical protein
MHEAGSEQSRRSKGNPHHWHTISKTRRGQGVADHLAIHLRSRRREGGAVIASIALASRVDDAGDSGVGVGPARCAGSRCSSTRLREVLAGLAVGTDGAALRGILPRRAGHTFPHHEGTSGSAKLADGTCLEGVAYKCTKQGQSKAEGPRQPTPLGTPSACTTGRSGSPGNSAHSPPSRCRRRRSQHCTCNWCGWCWREEKQRCPRKQSMLRHLTRRTCRPGRRCRWRCPPRRTSRPSRGRTTMLLHCASCRQHRAGGDGVQMCSS